MNWLYELLTTENPIPPSAAATATAKFAPRRRLCNQVKTKRLKKCHKIGCNYSYTTSYTLQVTPQFWVLHVFATCNWRSLVGLVPKRSCFQSISDSSGWYLRIQYTHTKLARKTWWNWWKSSNRIYWLGFSSINLQSPHIWFFSVSDI